MSFHSFWEMKSSREVWGTLVPNQRFYHEQHDFFNMALRSMFGDSSVEMLVTHILKAITKGSKFGFSAKSSQIEHFT